MSKHNVFIRFTKPVRLFQSSRFGLLVACYLLFNTHLLMAQDTIKWQIWNNSPADGVYGVEKKFYFSLVRETYIKNLPDIDHIKELVPLKRGLHRLKNGYQGCMVGLYKTHEREKYFYFSIPDTIIMPPGIAMSAETFSKLGQPDLISLADILMNKKELIMGIDSTKSYSQEIDNIIKIHHGDNNLRKFSPSGDTPKYMIKTLVRERFHYTILYPDDLSYVSSQVEGGDSLFLVPISEYQSIISSHTICPKNEWGKQTIEKINAIIRDKRNTKEFREIFSYWISESFLPSFHKFYDEVFIKF